MNRILSMLVSLGMATVAQLQGKDWLPKEAEICYRSRFEDGFLPDATYCLKAKVTKEQFDVIVKRIGATPHAENRKYSDGKSWLNWCPERGDDLKPLKGRNRWDPEDGLSTTFVRQEKDTWKFLKYEGGFLYYKELNH